jgi:repressor LexA
MTKKRLSSLTERQKKVLELIEYFIREYGYPPNDREICDMANIASVSAVSYVLRQLEEMGYIEMDTHASRGLRLLKTAEQVPVSLKLSEYFGHRSDAEMLEIPLAGRIFASIPIPFPAADLEPAEDVTNVEFPRSWLPVRLDPGGLFAFEVRGDSMLDALVNDGDLVILQPAKAARNGDFVAVWLKDRAERP